MSLRHLDVVTKDEFEDESEDSDASDDDCDLSEGDSDGVGITASLFGRIPFIIWVLGALLVNVSLLVMAVNDRSGSPSDGSVITF